jgi:hypothetical protein
MQIIAYTAEIHCSTAIFHNIGAACMFAVEPFVASRLLAAHRGRMKWKVFTRYSKNTIFFPEWPPDWWNKFWAYRTFSLFATAS